MDVTKIVVLVVVGLIILVTLAGEFRPRASRRARRGRSVRRSGDDLAVERALAGSAP